MPIQATQRSPSVWAINKAQDTFAINATDGKAKFAGKVAGRTLTNAALTVAAAVETVVFAVLTAVTLGLSKTLREGTKLAGRATVEAFKGMAGYKTEVQKQIAPTFFQRQIANAKYYRNKAVVAAKAGFVTAKGVATSAGNKALSHKRKIALAVAATGLAYVGYQYGSALAGKVSVPAFVTNNTVANYIRSFA